MAKILGKIMSISIGGVDVDLQSHGYDETYNLIDVTDTATVGDATENVVGRATRDLKIDGIFKLAGASVKANAMQLVAEATTYKCTDLNYEVTYDEIDLTDTNTASDSTEFQAGFATRKSKIDLWMQDTTASIPRGTALTSVLTFATGVTVSGEWLPESISNQGEVKGAQKQTINGTWVGAVTEVPTPITGFAMATSLAIVITYKDGTTGKALTGTGTIFSLSLTGEASDVLKVSYGIKFSGAVPETLYAV